MKIESYFTPGEVEPGSLAGRTAVVIDVIRATSVIVEALANGARAIYPTLVPSDAVALAGTLGRDDTLLCGERKGLKVEGFDLGNSPREFQADVVSGRRLVMSTTNGTRAFLAAASAGRVYAASLLNLSAVAARVANDAGLAVICAGKDGRFGLDDVVCGGLLIDQILRVRGETQEAVALDESSRTALMLSRTVTPDGAFFRETAAGAALVEIGLEEDLPFLAQRDRHTLVPEMHDRMIRVAEPSG
jgi:2-phosphosulfolactate phosphatase